MNDSTDRVKLIFNAVFGTKHYISAESIILYHNGSGKNALAELHERIAKCMPPGYEIDNSSPTRRERNIDCIKFVMTENTNHVMIENLSNNECINVSKDDLDTLISALIAFRRSLKS